MGEPKVASYEDLLALPPHHTGQLVNGTLYAHPRPVLSPSTARLDRGPKLDVYRREGVAHVWLVDPTPQTLEVLRLDGPTYRLAGTFGGDTQVRAEPFDAIEFDLGALWTW